MSDDAGEPAHDPEPDAPRRVQAADLKPGDRFRTDRADGYFVVQSVDGASAYRIVRTTAGKVFGLPRELSVWLHPEPAPQEDPVSGMPEGEPELTPMGVDSDADDEAAPGERSLPGFPTEGEPDVSG